jgi:hypothetical protein
MHFKCFFICIRQLMVEGLLKIFAMGTGGPGRLYYYPGIDNVR